MNNTSLAIIQSDELETIQRTGRMLAASGYFDGKGDTAQAIAMMATKIMAGREMGFGPFASVNGIHIIKGKPSIGANLMAAAVKGSSRYDYRVKEMSNDRCTIEFFEREGDKKVSIGISDFTRADAVAAETQNMSKFGRNMMFARALSNGVRWYCPDVFSGNAVYVPEELGANVDSDGNVIESDYSISSAQPVTSDNETGEIVDSKPAVILASAQQLDSLEKALKDLYEDKWDKNTAKWAQWATTGVTDDITQLSGEEVEAVIEKLLERIAKKVEKAAQGKAAQPQAETQAA
jgi:hypothetical protein